MCVNRAEPDWSHTASDWSQAPSKKRAQRFRDFERRTAKTQQTPFHPSPLPQQPKPTSLPQCCLSAPPFPKRRLFKDYHSIWPTEPLPQTVFSDTQPFSTQQSGEQSRKQSHTSIPWAKRHPSLLLSSTLQSWPEPLPRLLTRRLYAILP